MGKVFTITEGLENLGAMKTGGQGSVYKGRRIGEILTAIKLLPTPLHNESPEDKNYLDFQNEVQKLKKVNEVPNPNVVKILSSGVSDTGNFPFIEMEYIDGPDLEDLLQPPHDPIFTIKEAIKVADHLSHALAHCHKVEVRHGDVKSNNVKFNVHTGNYVLLDFGLAVMSDEQRRTSLRHAGAIEFMAPEQNEGQMLYQTDVYSFGVILFELLAGNVPFPLSDKGETARNAVRLSHMETAPPDLMTLRYQSLPESWSEEKKQHEMQVPQWMIDMVYKCLEKKAENRFANGIELYEYIVINSTLSAAKDEAAYDTSLALMEENKKLKKEKDDLQQSILQYRQDVASNQKELQELRSIIAGREGSLSAPLAASASTEFVERPRSGVSRSAFYLLLVLTILLGAFAAYSLFKNNGAQTQGMATTFSDSTDSSQQMIDDVAKNSTNEENKPANETQQKPAVDPTTQLGTNDNNVTDSVNNNADAAAKKDNQQGDQQNSQDNNDIKQKSLGQYKVVSKAYFYDEPDEGTRRDAFIVHWNNAVLNALDEQDGFVYVVFTNQQGQTSKGWLRKKDLTRTSE